MDVFGPAYFVALDHSTQNIVFTIRGTMSFTDLVTDLNADYVEFLGGKAHFGMLQSAKRFLNLAKKSISNLMQRYQDYKVVIVGHSLGYTSKPPKMETQFYVCYSFFFL